MEKRRRMTLPRLVKDGVLYSRNRWWRQRTCLVCLGCLLGFIPGSEHPPMSTDLLAGYPLVNWLFRHINICLEIYKVLTIPPPHHHRKTQIRKDHNLQHNNCIKCFWLSLWDWSDFLCSLLSCCTINTVRLKATGSLRGWVKWRGRCLGSSERASNKWKLQGHD